MALVEFMEGLAQKWTLFGPVLVSEQSAQVGQEVAQNEEKAVAEVENLLKENKLDEALATAGQATQDSQDASAILPPIAQEPVLPENPETPPPIPEEIIATDTQIAEEPPIEQISLENPPIQQENVDQNSTGIGGNT